MSESLRYHRQTLIEGWDQNKLKNAKIGIIGTGQAASCIGTTLGALGAGSVSILGKEKAKNSHQFLLEKSGKSDSSAEVIANRLKSINPLVEFMGIHSQLDETSLMMIDDSNMIIDATNDISSKKLSFEFCKEAGIPYFSIYADDSRAFLNGYGYFDASLADSFYGKDQGIIQSILLGGLIASEVVNILIFNKNRGPLGINYSLGSSNRFEKDDNWHNEFDGNEEEMAEKKVLMIGAGAIGAFVSLGISKLGIGSATIIDDDVVDIVNLNRQIHFYDAVGKKKAEVLAEKMKFFNKNISTDGLIMRFDETTAKMVTGKYDALLDCVDNFKSRVFENSWAVKNSLPLISGGVGPFSGQAYEYLPSHSSCLECQMNISKKKAEKPKDSCPDAPEPSIVGTNAIISGLMLGELYLTLLHKFRTNVNKRIMLYSSNGAMRLFEIGTKEACSCHKRSK